MINSATAQSSLVDDIPLAVSEIVDQLNKKIVLLKNSVGIVQCHTDFIDEGMIEALYDKLGFPIVGGTTVSATTDDSFGNTMFSLLVLTSDDVEFAAAHTVGLSEDYQQAITSSVEAARKTSDKPLKMVLVFPTVSDNNDLPGDCYIEAFVEVCGDVPIFGSLSVDDSLRNFAFSLSVCNAAIFSRELAYVMIMGDVNPRFFVAGTLKESSVMDTDAIVTKSNGPVIQRINNMVPTRYFESVKLAKDGQLKEGVLFIPFVVTIKDNEGECRVFVRALLGFDDDGHAIFRGKIPEGAIISVASLSTQDILKTTQDVVNKMAQEEGKSAALIFSCIIRRLCIGSDEYKELEVIRSGLSPSMPLLASYSGGEISPIGFNSKGIPLNAFNNYALIACLL